MQALRARAARAIPRAARLVLCSASLAAHAQESGDAGADAVADRPGSRDWGAAIGLVAGVGPEYVGSDRVSSSLQPGFALRWGRVSFASRSAFAVRSSDPGASGGLRVELARGERLRAGLGLRADSGRQESSSDRLAGMGDVRGTVRARLSASYRLDRGWRVHAAVMADALRRHTGTVVELGLGRDQRLSDSTTLGYGLALSGGDRRYLQAHFGVTPEQARRSGYPAYEPGSGLRSIGLSLGARTELAPQWAIFYGVGGARLLGAAADSPLSFERSSWNLSSGVVYRF